MPSIKFENIFDVVTEDQSLARDLEAMSKKMIAFRDKHPSCSQSELERLLDEIDDEILSKIVLERLDQEEVEIPPNEL